jgi:hypothetical protein
VDISLGEPRIFGLDQRLTFEELRRRADEKKTAALGSGIGGLLQRPKAEDVVLAASQRRVEPFWHVVSTAHYVYDRTRMYAVPASAGDVRSVTVLGSDLPVAPSGKGPASFALEVLEHCTDDVRDEVFVDGLTGTTVGNGAVLLAGARSEVFDPAELAVDGTLVVAPEQRASAIVRESLARVLRPLQADAVFEESLAVEQLELCYRPIWAFEFHLAAKDRRGVVEVDAITGDTRTATALRMSTLTRMVTRDMLFDLGADTAGLLVPGGSIAVKLAKVALDRPR